MERDWQDYKTIHSNIAGAREAFEKDCETLFRTIYEKQNVQQVAVKQGDGGIDIFIGEIGIEPITVIQCKFFLDEIGSSQQTQIRNSFKTAIDSTNYELKEWILCVPRVLSLDENIWWTKWKEKKIKENSRLNDFISIKNGNELIYLMKTHNLYNQIFKIEDSLKISEIHKNSELIKELIKPAEKNRLSKPKKKILTTDDLYGVKPFSNLEGNEIKRLYETIFPSILQGEIILLLGPGVLTDDKDSFLFNRVIIY